MSFTSFALCCFLGDTVPGQEHCGMALAPLLVVCRPPRSACVVEVARQEERKSMGLRMAPLPLGLGDHRK